MWSSIETPYRVGMNYGVGVDVLKGGVTGKGVDPRTITSVTGASGSRTSYFITLIESQESLYKSLGVSVGASGHYGLFSAGGRYSYGDEVKFNSQSTFLLVRCTVVSAFTQCEEALLEDGALKVLMDDGNERFRERYGDAFVRGVQTGGEFCAVISVSSDDLTEQREVAANLQASYTAGLGGVGGSGSFHQITKTARSRVSIQVVTYQEGGKPADMGLVRTLEEVYERAKRFPEMVGRAPVPYWVQLASYKYVDNYPTGSDLLDVQYKKDALERYAKLRLKYLTMKNNLEFIQDHPDYYENPPDLAKLNEWQSFVSGKIDNIEAKARSCASELDDKCGDVAYELPANYTMPKRKEGGVPAEESVRLGRQWLVQETGWQGVWSRRGNSRIFDAFWTKPGETPLRAVVEISLSGASVTVKRTDQTGGGCLYRGTIASDGVRVTGRSKCDWSGEYDWSATIDRD